MPLINLDKAPFPYYGGKRHAASLVWEALGDVNHYVEPFAGSLAVLLGRPHPTNRTYYSETVNDAHGLLCNAWRAIQFDPQATAEAASWPVIECDLAARHLAIVEWAAAPGRLEWLMGDPGHYDPVIAGWWLWGMACWIGSGFADGRGPWGRGPDGSLTRGAGGVNRQRPHVGNNGQGVNHAGAREPGIARKLPHMGDNGRGVNHAGAREPGIARKRPHVGNNGQGVNHAGAREPGIARQLPHMGDNGRGVNHAGAREPGIAPRLDWPDLVAADYAASDGFHPLTMPDLRRWFHALSARLRHVRVINGDWRRVCTPSVVATLPVRQGKGFGGIFLDPPYGTDAGRADDLYAHDSLSIAAEVRAWCLANGDNPRYRIVLAGFAGEGHEALEAHGWRAVPWFSAGFLRGGYAQQSADGHQQHRERLWLSPACRITSAERGVALPMDALWEEVDDAA